MPEPFGSIVIADDDPLTRSAYKAALQRVGYTVHAAEDGEQAIRLVEPGGVSLLILDILMPRKEGLETLLEMKSRFPAVAIIVISAGGPRGDMDLLSFATKFGADGILRKPFTPKTLLGLITELMPQLRARAVTAK